MQCLHRLPPHAPLLVCVRAAMALQSSLPEVEWSLWFRGQSSVDMRVCCVHGCVVRDREEGERCVYTFA